MPSPIATHGFQVNARPGIDYLDPRLLAPQYGSIIPAVGQGLGVYNQFQQIRDEAAMRPIRQQLAQIQVQEAQDRLAQGPLQNRIRQLQIAEAEQNAAVPRVLAGSSVIEEMPPSIYDTPAMDESGVRTGPMPMGDLVQITEENLYGPGGTVTPRRVTKTVKTAADRVAEEEKRQASIRASDALAGARGRGKEFESTSLMGLIESTDDPDLKAKAEARLAALNASGQAALMKAAALANNPGVSYVDQKRGDRTFRLYFPKGQPNQILHEIDRGELGSGSILNFGGGVVNVAPGAAPANGGDDIASLAKMYGAKGAGAPVAAKLPTLSVAEAAAALPNTIFIGIDGKKRKKNPDGTVSLIVE